LTGTAHIADIVAQMLAAALSVGDVQRGGGAHGIIKNISVRNHPSG